MTDVHVNGRAPHLEHPSDPAAARVIRETLEYAAQKIESMNGNSTYKQAWRIAARKLRDAKPD